eukprot:8060525-Pyramimonas_sp.AAC.1
MEKLDSITFGIPRIEVRGKIQKLRWSFFHVPLIWAAARQEENPPILDWMCQVLGIYGSDIHGVNGVRGTRSPGTQAPYHCF